MKNQHCIPVLLILLLLPLYALFACESADTTFESSVSTMEVPEKYSDILPPAAFNKACQLLDDLEEMVYAPLLCEKAYDVRTLGENIFVVISKWQKSAKHGETDSYYLPILVYIEGNEWNAIFLGENALMISPFLRRMEPGSIHTLSLQASPISDGFLFLAKGSYIRSALGGDGLTDSIGTKQQSIDLKEIDPSGCAAWLLAAQDPERLGVVNIITEKGTDLDKNDLILLYVEKLPSDYLLTCGELNVTGSDLLQQMQ